MIRPSLSILVPIYNVGRYLRQCLDSVIGQTLRDIEIICVNDGSTDNSLRIIQEYAKRDKRIIIIDKPNSGYGDSMNQALHRAKGEYIGIVEPDDWIDLDAFEQLYRLATSSKQLADVVKANYYKEQRGRRIRSSEISCSIVLNRTKNFADYQQVFHFTPAIWSAIYRREFLQHNHIEFLPTPGASYQDLGFSLKVWSCAQRVVLTPDAFLHYRLDNASSSVHNPGKVNCVVEEYASIEQFLKSHPSKADGRVTLYDEVAPLVIAAKFANYHWNLQRLTSRPAKEFYKTFIYEFRQAQQEGIIQRSYFSLAHWLALQGILRFPHLSHCILRLRSNLMRLR